MVFDVGGRCTLLCDFRSHGRSLGLRVLQSEGSEVAVPCCSRILQSSPSCVWFFMFCPVEGGVHSQTNSPSERLLKVRFWWRHLEGAVKGMLIQVRDMRWGELETMIEKFKWLYCMELAKEWKGHIGNKSPGSTKFFVGQCHAQKYNRLGNHRFGCP